MTSKEFIRLVNKYRQRILETARALHDDDIGGDAFVIIDSREDDAFEALIEAFKDTNQKLEQRSAALDKLNGWIS